MNGFRQICIASKCRQGGRVIGLQQVPDIELWRLKIEALLPGHIVLQVPPDPLNRVPFGTIRREPYGPDILGPLNPLGGVGSAVIQQQDVQAVRKGLGERLDEELKALRVQLGQLQEKALTGGRGYGPVDVEPLEGVPDQAHRLDAPGREAPVTDRPQADAAVVLTEDPYRAGIRGWHDMLQPLATPRLNHRNGLRGYWCDWAAGL
jgi:hypothetical protein